MRNPFKRKTEPEPNPWLKIEHDCVMLLANDGKEEVCGLCGHRELTKEGEKSVSKRSYNQEWYLKDNRS